MIPIANLVLNEFQVNGERSHHVAAGQPDWACDGLVLALSHTQGSVACGHEENANNAYPAVQVQPTQL
jgi:hypothetical protein